MNISAEARSVIGLILITVPTIEFGGYFLLSQLRKATVIKSDKQAAYYRAGHAHAGVLVILAIIAQLLIDVPAYDATYAYLLRAGFFLPPILISAGFFLGAPTTTDRPGRPIVLIPIGALLLAASAILLGLGFVFDVGTV